MSRKQILGAIMIVVSLMTLCFGFAVLIGTPVIKAISITLGFSALAGGIAGGIYLLEQGDEKS